MRLGDGFVVSSAGYERARELVVAECNAAGEIALARFRDLAGVVGAMPSSCSSGSTRTGSRAGWATAGCCGAQAPVSRAGEPGEAKPRRGLRLVSPLGLVVDPDRVRDAVDVVEVADHLDRIVDRGVVPPMGPERVRVLEPDRGRDRRQLDGVITERTNARLEIRLPIVVGRMLRQLVICALCTEVVCMRKRSVVALVDP